MVTKKKRFMCMVLSTAIVAQISSSVIAGNTLASSSDPAYTSQVLLEASEVSAPAANAPKINDHVKIAESTDYNLYFLEDDLSIIVEDKKTGKYMESAISYDDGKSNKTWYAAMKSALVLTIISGNDDTKQADLINDDVTKDITYLENGFSAKVKWKKYGFGMELIVQLTDEGLSVRIPDSSIVEENENFFIGTISKYPFLGNSYLDDKEGYLLFPDGNGGLIYLNDKEGTYSTGFSSMIYGKDYGFEDSQVINLLWDRYEMVTEAEKVIAPIFGIAHTDDKIAYLGVVEDGAMRASIEAHPNGVNVNYNRAFAKFVLRRNYTQPTSNNSTSGSLHLTEADRTHSDLAVRYLFLSGDDADYAGMATAYRDYLTGNGELKTSLDTSYDTRVDFLGTDRESWLMGTRAVTMTTADDIVDIYDDLEKSGVTDLFSVYKGWQDGGINDLPITKYDADSKVGGTGDVKKALSNAESRGISLYLYDDALRINPDEHNATFNVVKRINKRRFTEETYKDVYEQMLFLTPARSTKLLNGFVNKYTKKNGSNLAVAGISNALFSYTYGGKTYTRFNTAESYETLLDNVAEKTDLVLEQPFSYLWHDTEAFLDMPMYTSSFMFEDESVPFLSLVLKGVMPVYSEYVNFEANKTEFFLKLVETGTFPSFYVTKENTADLLYTNSNDIYSAQYDVYKDTIISYTNSLKELNSKTEGSTIVEHDILGNGITRVIYSNGVKVYVNYSQDTQSADGTTVEGMSYKIVG